MKELKSSKEPKKKPGQFQKSKKKFQNIQHNRDQLKLLKDQVVDHAELFVLEDDGNFYKVLIKPFPEVPYDAYSTYEYVPVVYLSQGKKGRLRLSHLIGKDAYPRCKVGEGFIPWEHCFGIVTSKELLSSKECADPTAPIA